MDNNIIAKFMETNEIDFELGFQKIDFIKNLIIESDPDLKFTKWDIYNDF